MGRWIGSVLSILSTCSTNWGGRLCVASSSNSPICLKFKHYHIFIILQQSLHLDTNTTHDSVRRVYQRDESIELRATKVFCWQQCHASAFGSLFSYSSKRHNEISKQIHSKVQTENSATNQFFFDTQHNQYNSVQINKQYDVDKSLSGPGWSARKRGVTLRQQRHWPTRLFHNNCILKHE